MTPEYTRLDDKKLVLKVAQAVWASNKYLVLACGQKYYLQVREELRPDNVQLEAAYNTLNEVINKFKNAQTEKLPELKNALYHMAGYLKNDLPRDKRQEINGLIQSNPKRALEKLEYYTFKQDVSYLKMSTIWPKHRTQPFNENFIEIKDKENIYPAKKLIWKDDYILLKE